MVIIENQNIVSTVHTQCLMYHSTHEENTAIEDKTASDRLDSCNNKLLHITLV